MTLPDYGSLLADASRAGVYQFPHANEELQRAAEAQGFMVFQVDLARARAKEAMLSAIGKSMGFPEWFGYNFDALADSLNDLGWRPALGYVVFLQHCDGIRSRAEQDFALALRIFAQASEQWRAQGIPFWCFVGLQDHDVAGLPTLS